MKKYSLVMKWSYKYDKESTWIEHDDGENRYELEEGAVHPLPHIGDRELEILAVRAEGDATVVELRIDGRELTLQSGEEPAVQQRSLAEASRVLKAGGQLILGAVCYPAAVNALAGILADNGEERHPFRRDEMAELLAGCGFEKVTWQRTGFGTGVMIAWKRKPEVDELRNAK